MIYFGPQAQEVIRPFLHDRATNAFLFSPAESDTERRERQHAERKTPDGQGNEPGTNRKENPKRKPGARFTTNTYHRAIQYVCDRTFPPPPLLTKRDGETVDAWRDRLEAEGLWDDLAAWRRAHRFHPHQLRHNAATELRKAFGLEAAQLTLGHASAQKLFALAYNLGNFLRRLALPHSVKHGTLTTLREKLVKIGAKVVAHSRYVIFQMAEVAIPRKLFGAILERIARLRRAEACVVPSG